MLTKKFLLGTAATIGAVTIMSCDNDYRRRIAAEVLPYHSIHFNRVQGLRKRDLFAGMTGNVLEIGPGTGANFKYLPPHITWSGVERNPHALKGLRRSAAESGFAPPVLSIHQRDALGYLKSLPSDSQNAVLGTLVLGSSDHHEQLAKEIFRVLRPGGKYYFVERCPSPNAFWRGLQYLALPLSKLLHVGVDPTRNTTKSILEAGFMTKSIYCEQWGYRKPADHHRYGVDLVTVSAKRQEQHPSDWDVILDGLHGMRPLVAGVAIKERDLLTINERVAEYNPYSFATRNYAQRGSTFPG